MQTELLSRAAYKYKEHQAIEVEGFQVVDATLAGPRPHDDLVWVGRDGSGKWLTPSEALALSVVIAAAANNNLARRGLPI
jgi:hypothetical protein